MNSTPIFAVIGGNDTHLTNGPARFVWGWFSYNDSGDFEVRAPGRPPAYLPGPLAPVRELQHALVELWSTHA